MGWIDAVGCINGKGENMAAHVSGNRKKLCDHPKEDMGTERIWRASDRFARRRERGTSGRLVNRSETPAVGVVMMGRGFRIHGRKDG